MADIRELNPEQCRELARMLGDRLEIVITRDQLMRGKSRHGSKEASTDGRQR